jgi:hypothetical protein
MPSRIEIAYGEVEEPGRQLVPRRLNGMPTRRNAREWLEAALNGEVMLTPQQFACAKVLIEYEAPKLGRTGTMLDADTFAVQLEKAIERSRIASGQVIDITPTKETSE